ncbi:MAG: MarR family transcriptional regulator [Gammaproteobacteria bacterium]|nr:MarR family transcriptional regulator [Gammaproteobacteria bacterium]
MADTRVPTTKPVTMDSDTADTDFEKSLTFLLSTLGSRIALIAEQTLRQTLDLSYMEWRVIQIVGTEKCTRPNRIIAVTGVNKANVSRAITALEQRGLLLRTHLEFHARNTELQLTRSGKVVYQKGNSLRRKAETPLLAGLSDNERNVLGNALRRIMRNVDGIRGTPGKHTS